MNCRNSPIRNKSQTLSVCPSAHRSPQCISEKDWISDYRNRHTNVRIRQEKSKWYLPFRDKSVAGLSKWRPSTPGARMHNRIDNVKTKGAQGHLGSGGKPLELRTCATLGIIRGAHKRSAVGGVAKRRSAKLRLPPREGPSDTKRVRSAASRDKRRSERSPASTRGCHALITLREIQSIYPRQRTASATFGILRQIYLDI